MSQENMLDPVLVAALKNVKYPGFEMSIVDMELVLEARLEGAKAVIKLRPVNAPPEVRKQLEEAVAAAVSQAPGVKEMELHLPEPPQVSQLDSEPQGPRPLEGVKAIVPVASGKGGVGKSTVAVNLALGLSKLGLKVGLLDLDLYGPSIPTMLGIKDAVPESEGDMLKPIEVQNLKVVSIGFLLDDDKALIWRGPLIMKAVTQLLHQVVWGSLDVLILDLPPGTGDVQISMAQEVPIHGAVVVTTPQDVALLDAIKAVDMFRNVNAPVYGIVENMSYFTCSECGHRHEIFGHGSVEPLTKRLGVDFLGELPLDPKLALEMDKGLSPVISGEQKSEGYMKLAEKVKAKLQG